MAATRYDIVCEQGADLRLTVTYLDETGAPVNLTGGLARLQARKTVRATTPFLDLDSAAKGGLVLGGVAGTITIAVSAAATGAIDPIPDAVYDLEYVHTDAKVYRVIEGKFKVTAQVTR